MNRTIKTACLLGAFSVFLFSGCKKEKYGHLSIDLTDAPGDYLKVNVDIQSVEAHYTNGSGWTTLNTNSGVYDLLTLQNNVTAPLTSGTQLPVGKITQLRLMLGPNNTVMLNDSTTHPLRIPSSLQSGIKINVDAQVPANNNIVITLDYDADASIHKEGNGDYTMNPVIKIKSIY